jgi:hypothetical protein
MTEEFTPEEEAYFLHIERIENILVVLDDALEVICKPPERLAVIEAVCLAIDLEPDCVELYNHIKDKI